MKTNQLMIRKMGEFEVTQRTKDGLFNATALLKQWNESIGMKKTVKDFFSNKNTKEFLQVLENDKDFLNEGNSPYLKSRGKSGGTWMHPYLFIKFAMWINPKFELQVIKFVYDEMIKYRNEAGNAYKELGSAVGKIVNKSFMPQAMKKISQGLNYIVFNEHETGIRNKYGIEEKQRELFQLENKITDLINEGFITDFERLKSYMQDLWRKKHQPKVFTNG